MSEKTDDGGPAFPQLGFGGMSLRDYFAASALKGLLADSRPGALTHGSTKTEVAKHAYYYADAMLKAREGGSRE